MENLKKSFLVRGNNIVGFSDKNFSTAPLGTVLSFAGQARPNGYLLCDGASYKVTDYPDLYAVIGNTYGGDTENFNVPNLVDASQSPAPTMIYIIKAFHTNEGVDSDAGSGEENKIDSISVNGSPVSIDQNKNVDITVPTVTNDLTDELKSSYDDAVTAKHTHENGTVLDKFSESNEGVLLFNGEKIESELALDSTPTKDSKNYVNSGVVYGSLFKTKQRTVIDTPENYVACAASDEGALEVVADDTTPTTTQVALSIVQAFVPTAQVGEYYQHIDEVSHLEDYEDTIYREKDDSYSSIEVDEKIKEVNDRITEIASGGLKPLSLTDYQSFMDSLVISADGYVAP